MDRQLWNRIRELFTSAVEMEPSQRAEFLDQACAGDNELRKEVEALLASDEEAGSFIQVPVLNPDGEFLKQPQDNSFSQSENQSPILSLFHPEVAAKSKLHARQIIAGRYELIARLGTGGMGEVWHAYDVKLRVDVALKSLRRDFKGANADPLEFLRHEVRIAREVISPNVCRIFDLVSEEDYELISMERIDGITLMDLMEEKGPLSLRDARDIAAQFLAGLDAIHTAGLVHRDLKPENIMITRTGRVVVMDLGIAQPQSEIGGIISGTLPYMSPEQIAGEQVDARSDIFSAGVVLAEMIHTRGSQSGNTRERIWQAIRKDPMQLPESGWREIIVKAVSETKEDRFESATALAHALEEITSRSETEENKIPYPGLSSFSESDSEFFFGREQEVETLLKKMQQLHMMALIGPSGAGKTSFLQAGLIPALPKEWGRVLINPGGAPIANLRQAITPLLAGDEEASTRINNFEDPDTAIWILSRVRQTHSELILVIDRFEELFTLSSREAQTRFAEFLGRATLEADVRVLIAMRDDFFLMCHEHAPIDPVFSEPTPTSPLSGASLRRALVQPALKCGYKFEDESLVHDILSDVEKERGALPLLAFAASVLWEKRDRNKGQLTRKAYEETGGVRGALAQHAENTLQQIGVDQESMVREIFRNLITAQNTRIARDQDELLSVFHNSPGTPRVASADETSALHVLRSLINARLLTSFENRVEITHESLITNWPRLVKWQAQDVENAQMRDELRQASQIWNQKGRPVELLWTGAAYLEFQLWRERYPGGLTATEQAFAGAMTQYANRSRKRRRILVSATFVTLLLIVFLIANSWRKESIARNNAVIQAKQAQASKLLVIGRSLPDSDTSRKLAYATASLETTDTLEARRFALQILSHGTPPFTFLKAKELTRSLFSPDDKYFLAAVDGILKLFARDGSPAVSITNDFNPWPQFTKDSKFVIWTSPKIYPKNIRIWSIEQKKIIRTIPMQGFTSLMPADQEGNIYIISDTTGTELIGAGFDSWSEIDLRVLTSALEEPGFLAHFNIEGLPRLQFGADGIHYLKPDGIYFRPYQDSGPGQEKMILRLPEKPQYYTFHPSGKFVAVSYENEIRFYSLDASSIAPMRIFSASGEAEFDPAGRYLEAVTGDKLLLWDLLAPAEAEPTVIQHPAGELLNFVSFDHPLQPAKGRWFAITWETSIEFYSLQRKEPFVFMRKGIGGSAGIRFTPDGKSLVDGFPEGILMWNVRDAIQSPARLVWQANHGMSFDIDPAGKHVVASGNRFGALGPFLISLEDFKQTTLKHVLPDRAYHNFSFSVDGKFLAGVTLLQYPGDPECRGIELWNLQNGEVQVVKGSMGQGSYAVKFAPDGTLFSGDDSGNLYHWNLNTHTHENRRIGDGIVTSIAITKDGRYLAAISVSGKKWEDVPSATSTLVLLDLKENKLNQIASHGNRLFRVTFDPSGTKFITGDLDGVVRVGTITGEEPHLLLGHQGWVGDVAADPQGKWIVSTEMNKPIVRLWTMPEGMPLQTLSQDELIKHLQRLINVRVVADQNSSNGYRMELTHFPGW